MLSVGGELCKIQIISAEPVRRVSANRSGEWRSVPGEGAAQLMLTAGRTTSAAQSRHKHAVVGTVFRQGLRADLPMGDDLGTSVMR